jgi:short-subunit dehydrogenase
MRSAARLRRAGAGASDLRGGPSRWATLPPNELEGHRRIITGASSGIGLAVANAGVNYRGPFDERTAGEIVGILDTNLIAPILLARAALDHLHRGGAIVNVASLAGKVPLPDEATYCASKSGLRALSSALAIEVEERGIHVASVNPGPVDTGFSATSRPCPISCSRSR